MYDTKTKTDFIKKLDKLRTTDYMNYPYNLYFTQWVFILFKQNNLDGCIEF